jgi:hypothetical protein
MACPSFCTSAWAPRLPCFDGDISNRFRGRNLSGDLLPSLGATTTQQPPKIRGHLVSPYDPRYQYEFLHCCISVHDQEPILFSAGMQGLGDISDPPGGVLGVDMPAGVRVPEVPAQGPFHRGRCRQRVLRCRHRAHFLRPVRRQQVLPPRRRPQENSSQVLATFPQFLNNGMRCFF